MCRTNTPTEKLVMCGRCGKAANPTDGWEHGWPLHGRIELGFPSCIFAGLSRWNKAIDPWADGWKIGHPAARKNEAQFVEFAWTHESAYCLCYECQGALIELVGEFFGYGDASVAARLKRARADRLRAQADAMETP